MYGVRGVNSDFHSGLIVLCVHDRQMGKKVHKRESAENKNRKRTGF